MYSVLSVFTWRPMPAAVRSKLCDRVLAWVGVFARSAMSLAQSASVIVCSGYLLLLSFVSLKPLPFILSIDVLSTLFRQMIKRYGANVSHCSTPAKMSKQSVSPSGEQTFVFLYSLIIAAIVSFGRPQASSICSIFPLCMGSKALERSTNNIVASMFFAYTLSRIRWIVKVCDVVDRFFRKPFSFFLSIFSIFGSMRLLSRALYILAAIDVTIIPRQFLANPRSSLLGKGRMRLFVHLSIMF